MKTRILFFFLATILLLGTSSCTKDDFSPNGSDDSISSSDVSATLTSGSGWVITYFFDKKDETAHFTGYTFLFDDSGKLTATKGSTTVTGSWRNGNDDSKTKLIISFSSPDNFEELSEDWRVLERTDSKIRLQHVSGGNGGTDLLTFEHK